MTKLDNNNQALKDLLDDFDKLHPEGNELQSDSNPDGQEFRRWKENLDRFKEES
jgi:hypothetical protein